VLDVEKHFPHHEKKKNSINLKQPIYLKQFERILKLLENKRQTSSRSKCGKRFMPSFRFTEKKLKKTDGFKIKLADRCE